MSELLTGLLVVGEALAVWGLVSLVALVPMVFWFRLQAVSNQVRFQEARRQAWLADSHPANLG